VLGGLAVRSGVREVEVRRYLLRLGCTNGSIAAQRIWMRCMPRVAADSSPENVAAATSELRSAIRACCEPHVLDTTLASIRRSQLQEADLADFRRWAKPRLPVSRVSEVQAAILQRFREEGDRSLFGLMNAVTSLARDERDPEVRWRPTNTP
jgi:hypothetical protein